MRENLLENICRVNSDLEKVRKDIFVNKDIINLIISYKESVDRLIDFYLDDIESLFYDQLKNKEVKLNSSPYLINKDKNYPKDKQFCVGMWNKAIDELSYEIALQ